MLVMNLVPIPRHLPLTVHTFCDPYWSSHHLRSPIHDRLWALFMPYCPQTHCQTLPKHDTPPLKFSSPFCFFFPHTAHGQLTIHHVHCTFPSHSHHIHCQANVASMVNGMGIILLNVRQSLESGGTLSNNWGNDNNGNLSTYVAMAFNGQCARYFKVMYPLSHPL
jgi:hypothetical protein